MMGESNYAECAVKRKNQSLEMLYKGALVLVCAILVVLALFLKGILMVIACVLAIIYVVFLVQLWPKFHVEYEYVFVDGQVDFDVIYSGNARKQLRRLDMESMEIVAPIDAPELDEYRHFDSELKAHDYTSGYDDARIYVIYGKGEKSMEKVLFEPDDNFLKFMKQKSPRKVVGVKLH